MKQHTIVDILHYCDPYAAHERVYKSCRRRKSQQDKEEYELSTIISAIQINMVPLNNVLSRQK